jgi:hypothetical protein
MKNIKRATLIVLQPTLNPLQVKKLKFQFLVLKVIDTPVEVI